MYINWKFYKKKTIDLIKKQKQSYIVDSLLEFINKFWDNYKNSIQIIIKLIKENKEFINNEVNCKWFYCKKIKLKNFIETAIIKRFWSSFMIYYKLKNENWFIYFWLIFINNKYLKKNKK